MRAYLGSTGISVAGVCDACSGSGLLDSETATGLVTVTCKACDGRGGYDPEAIARFRELDRAYEALLLDDDTP